MEKIATVLGSWRTLGVQGSQSAQVFAIGDVHGQSDLLETTLATVRHRMIWNIRADFGAEVIGSPKGGSRKRGDWINGFSA